jgi:hypothetical protein
MNEDADDTLGATLKHNVLMTICAMAVKDDGFCAHDVIEVLEAFGYGAMVRDARNALEEKQ